MTTTTTYINRTDTANDGPDAFCIKYRAAAVVMRGDRVLIHRAPVDDFWALPGGNVEPGESAASAVIRELHEEAGLEARVERCLWVVDNFFVYDGQRYHEHGLFFLMNVDEGAAAADAFEGYEHTVDMKLIFRWVDRSCLSEVDLRPAFLNAAIAAGIPSTTEYRVQDEDGIGR